MMVHFGRHADFFERGAHRRTYVLQAVDRWHRKVAALHARTMPGVAFGVVLARVPGGVNRIDLDEAALQAGIVTDRIEDEEFVFRTEERGVGNTRRLQIFLGALGKRTRVTAVARSEAHTSELPSQMRH